MREVIRCTVSVLTERATEKHACTVIEAQRVSVEFKLRFVGHPST